MDNSKISAVEKKVLIVEDEAPIQRLMEKTLGPYFDVQTASDRSSAEQILSVAPFDLILMDINLPGGSGLDLCQKIKSSVFQRHTPIILVSGMATVEDKINGLRLGADDYITKPFSPAELMARSYAAVRKNTLTLEANPLTKLPGNGSIEREIYRQITSNSVFSVLYLDINNFKPYNDYFGFYRGDLVIQKTGEILVNLVDTTKDLVGHIGGDDFIVVTTRPDVEPLCEDIIRHFDSVMPYFYDKDDLERGFIITKDRNGKPHEYPPISLAIGVASNRARPLHSVGEVSTVGSELKCFAKTKPGSFFAVERRHDPYPAPQKNGAQKFPRY
jgi:PleD family two-component response regulator